MFYKDNLIGKELDGWQMVYSNRYAPKAYMACQLLQQEGFEAVVHNRLDSMYLSFGEVEVYVPKAEFEKALEKIGGFEL